MYIPTYSAYIAKGGATGVSAQRNIWRVSNGIWKEANVIGGGGGTLSWASKAGRGDGDAPQSVNQRRTILLFQCLF